MERSEFAALYTRLEPHFSDAAKYSGYSGLWRETFEGEMRFALVRAWTERPEVLGQPDSGIVGWCRFRARFAMQQLRAHGHESLESLPETASVAPLECSPARHHHRVIRYQNGPIGQRADRQPGEVTLTDEEWTTLRQLAGRDYDVDPVDLDRFVERLPEQLRQIARSILCGFSGRQIERAGYSYRQVVNVSNGLKDLAA